MKNLTIGLLVLTIFICNTLYARDNIFNVDVSEPGDQISVGQENGNLQLTASGNAKIKLNSNSGIYTNDDNILEAHGVATLVGGTVVISTSLISEGSEIFVTGQDGSISIGDLWVSDRVPGVSFTISSTNIMDVRKVAWRFRLSN